MKSRSVWFNTYLVLLIVALAGGCKSTDSADKSKEKKPDKKEATTLGFHPEENQDGTGHSSAVQVSRNQPFTVNVRKSPILTELNVQKASVIDVLGGFQIMIQFDRQGTWILEQYSVADRGKRLAVFSQFGQARWLAAPVLERRIADGVLVFTPDASHEEAERIVRGLNNIAKKAQKDNW
jgi:preprotein translocase subunit SecD